MSLSTLNIIDCSWVRRDIISQLPLAGYVMASGIFTHLGVMPPTLGSKKVAELATGGLNDVPISGRPLSLPASSAILIS